MDWQTLVANLMTAERTPETSWKGQQNSNTTKMSTVDTMNTDLLALQTAAKALNSDSVFGARSATVSDSTVGSATAQADTLMGDYKFQVSSLATESTLVGAANVGSGISATSDVSGVTVSTMNLTNTPTAGTFTVNGKQIVVTATESLKDVLDAISTATSGAVTASYTPSTTTSGITTGDTISLTSSGTITLGSGSDTSNFLSALKLYSNGTPSVTSTSALGVVSTGSTLANANFKLPISNVDSSGNGTFSINNTAIAFNVNTDTVQGLMSRINSSDAGVTMTYDPTIDQFSLVNNSTGSLGISTSETSGGLLAAMGLSGSSTLSLGADAKVQVNGGPILTSNSNTFDSTVTGITGLSFTATSLGSSTTTVASDTTNAASLINNFISSYNGLQSFISSQSNSSTDTNGKVSAGILASDRDVGTFASSLQSLVFNSIPGLTGTINSLDRIGIGFSSMTNILTITDQTKLTNALQTNPSGVSALFNTPSTGLVAQLNAFVTKTDDATTGFVAAEKTSLTALNASLQSQIDALETKVNNTNTQMTNEYIAMETAISQIQTETQTLTSYFGSSSTSTSSSKTS